MEPKTRGTLMCPLHKDHPDRTQVNALGFAAINCRGNKSNLMTQLDVENHVKHTHKKFHERMERARIEDLAERQMALMEQQTAAMERMATGGIAQVQPLPPQPEAVTTSSTGPVPLTVTAKAKRATPAQLSCADCDYVTPEGHGAPQFPLGKHRKEMHPAT